MRKCLIIAVLALGLQLLLLRPVVPILWRPSMRLCQPSKLSDADKTKVMNLRKSGEEQHTAGEHAASVKTLGEAKMILGIQ